MHASSLSLTIPSIVRPVLELVVRCIMLGTAVHHTPSTHKAMCGQP